MAFPNYYVGSNLTDLGSMMTRDRAIDVQEQEQKRLKMQALMTMLDHQRDEQMRQQQFQQELAFRNQELAQRGDLANRGLNLNERQFTSNEGHFGQDDAYRYAALRNALEIAKTRPLDPRIDVENMQNQGRMQEQLFKAVQDWNYESSSAQAKAAEANARVKSIAQQAEDAGKKFTSWGFHTKEGQENERQRVFKAGMSELLNALQMDRRPGTISPDSTGTNFVPVVPPHPVAPGLMQNPAGLRSPQTMGTQTNGVPSQLLQALGSQTNAAPAQADQPITVRTSDGRVRQGMASQFQKLKALDPGAVIVGQPTQQQQQAPPPSEDGGNPLSYLLRN
jgi:hypothetical protein